LILGNFKTVHEWIFYCLAVCRQIFNFGKKQDHYFGDNPVCEGYPGLCDAVSVDNTQKKA